MHVDLVLICVKAYLHELKHVHMNISCYVVCNISWLRRKSQSTSAKSIFVYFIVLVFTKTNMALPITKWGSWSRSAGIYSALAKQAKLINYGAVQKLTFEFDPFRDVEEKFNHTR